MELVGLLGFAAVVVASFAVGLRLLWLASRTRQLPELMIGGAFVFAGGVPGVLILLADDGSGAGPSAGANGGLLAAISLSMLLGVTMLSYFTWRVFRPGERWGALFFAAIVAGLVVGHGGGALAALGPLAAAGPVLLWVGVGCRIVAYAWASAEATREYLAARRRCALGLTDPLVANRMLLMSIGLGSVLAIWIHEATTLATGGGAGSYLVIAVLGLLCAGSLWLAFFPPAFYQRRIAAGAPR